MGLELDIIEKSGSWFSYKGERIGQGKDKVRALFESNAELMDELEELIKEKMKDVNITEDTAPVLDDDDDDFEIALAGGFDEE